MLGMYTMVGRHAGYVHPWVYTTLVYAGIHTLVGTPPYHTPGTPHHTLHPVRQRVYIPVLSPGWREEALGSRKRETPG